MRIVQIAHALHPTDAASRQLLAMDGMLRGLGYDTAMYAHRVEESLKGRVSFAESFDASPSDAVIYHMTTGTSFNRRVWNYPQKVALFYHNITPAKYFFGNAWGSWLKCLKGRRDLKKIAKNTFFAWGASEYSRKELEEVGISATAVLPIVVDPKFYLGRGCDESVMKYRDGRLNILVVGRGVPHKKIHEAMEAAAWYRDNISPKIRLVVVGNMKPSYEKKLRALYDEKRLSDTVIFTGHISDDTLASWYRVADGLLTLSEHEGFCVPLIEAMIFGLPVFARPAAAIPETLGGAGTLLYDASPKGVSEKIANTLSDDAALARMKEGRRERLEQFSTERVAEKLKKDMETLCRLWKEQRK